MATSNDGGGDANKGITRRDAFLLAAAVGTLGVSLGAQPAEGAETVHLYLKMNFDKVLIKLEVPNADATKPDDVLEQLEVTKHISNIKFRAGKQELKLRLYTIKGAKATVESETALKAAPETPTPPK